MRGGPDAFRRAADAIVALAERNLPSCAKAVEAIVHDSAPRAHHLAGGRHRGQGADARAARRAPRHYYGQRASEHGCSQRQLDTNEEFGVDCAVELEHLNAQSRVERRV